ncbi:hypothetical protein M5D96_010921 [Drosophila gunungcola]|uniref:Uncharacterized protein n=1 Tax=Drosophila gunungcola TaxID=103775 RepID=A0A9P9YGF7_9MUSC|nr:hypothetical protein M5D96_010921 [Drosophila gunungcola]
MKPLKRKETGADVPHPEWSWHYVLSDVARSQPSDIYDMGNLSQQIEAMQLNLEFPESQAPAPNKRRRKIGDI